MNLTTHPLAVAAELAWRADLLGGANLATQHRRPRRRLHWPQWPQRGPRPVGTPRHTPRPA
jgi:hypothetical protein